MRILNGIIASLCVITGSFISGNINKNSIIMSIVVFLCVIAGNIINDHFDFEIDRVNRPEKIKKWERFGRKKILFFSLILFFLGNIISISSGLIYFFITITATTILILYTPLFKPYLFTGNLIISFISGFTFILGSITNSNIKPSLFPFMFAFLLHLPREIIKDIEDIEGDRKSNLKTLPIVIGEKKSLNISFFLIFLLFLFTIVSLFYFNIYFKITMILLFDLPMIYLILKAIRKDDIRIKSSYLEKGLKILMITGLIVIISGGIK